jgi:uncharacterized protein YndB with AHSA1/START domain
MDIVETFDIDAPAAVVWSVIADVERWPTWTDSIDDLRLTSASMAVGATAEVKQPGMPRATWTVTEWEPGRSFTWEATGPGIRTSGVHSVEPTGGATSRATLAIHESGPLDGVMRLLFGSRFRRFVAMEAAGLTRRSQDVAAAS